MTMPLPPMDEHGIYACAWDTDGTAPATLARIIEIMESTDEESWNLDTVRSADGTRNCFFGHLFAAYEPDEETANQVWDWFEGRWASTYMIYPVNDGENPLYPQRSPKQRILAYLRDLRDGHTPSTWQYDCEMWAKEHPA